DRRCFTAFARTVAAWIAEKDNDEHAYHVEGGQKRGEQRHCENRQVVLVGHSEKRVLTEKSAERRTAEQRQRTRSESGESNWKSSSQLAHLPNVLFVMKHHDD